MGHRHHHHHHKHHHHHGTSTRNSSPSQHSSSNNNHNSNSSPVMDPHRHHSVSQGTAGRMGGGHKSTSPVLTPAMSTKRGSSSARDPSVNSISASDISSSDISTISGASGGRFQYDHEHRSTPKIAAAIIAAVIVIAAMLGTTIYLVGVDKIGEFVKSKNESLLISEELNSSEEFVVNDSLSADFSRYFYDDQEEPAKVVEENPPLPPSPPAPTTMISEETTGIFGNADFSSSDDSEGQGQRPNHRSPGVRPRRIERLNKNENGGGFLPFGAKLNAKNWQNFYDMSSFVRRPSIKKMQNAHREEFLNEEKNEQEPEEPQQPQDENSQEEILDEDQEEQERVMEEMQRLAILNQRRRQRIMRHRYRQRMRQQLLAEQEELEQLKVEQQLQQLKEQRELEISTEKLIENAEMLDLAGSRRGGILQVHTAVEKPKQIEQLTPSPHHPLNHEQNPHQNSTFEQNSPYDQNPHLDQTSPQPPPVTRMADQNPRVEFDLNRRTDAVQTQPREKAKVNTAGPLANLDRRPGRPPFHHMGPPELNKAVHQFRQRLLTSPMMYQKQIQMRRKQYLRNKNGPHFARRVSPVDQDMDLLESYQRPTFAAFVSRPVMEAKGLLSKFDGLIDLAETEVFLLKEIARNITEEGGSIDLPSILSKVNETIAEKPDSTLGRLMSRFYEFYQQDNENEIERTSLPVDGELEKTIQSMLFLTFGMFLLNAVNNMIAQNQDSFLDEFQSRSFHDKSQDKTQEIFETFIKSNNLTEEERDDLSHIQDNELAAEGLNGFLRILMNVMNGYHSSDKPEQHVDCLWAVYCRQLNKQAGLGGMVSTVARINSVGMRVMLKDLTTEDAMPAVAKNLLEWRPIQCERMFNKCDMDFGEKAEESKSE